GNQRPNTNDPNKDPERNKHTHHPVILYRIVPYKDGLFVFRGIIVPLCKHLDHVFLDLLTAFYMIECKNDLVHLVVSPECFLSYAHRNIGATHIPFSTLIGVNPYNLKKDPVDVDILTYGIGLPNQFISQGLSDTSHFPGLFHIGIIDKSS